MATKLLIMFTFIFLFVFFYLFYLSISTIFKRPFSIGKLIKNIFLLFVSFLFILYFFNTEHSLESKLEKEEIQRKEEAQRKEEISSDNPISTILYDNEKFTMLNFENKIEFPIPNYLETFKSEDNSEFLRLKKDLIKENENISFTSIGITAELKRSNLNQNNFSDITDYEMRNFLAINEKFTKELLPAWGLSDFEISNSTIINATTNKDTNYLKLTYDLNNKGREATASLLLIPTDKEMIRILLFYYPENSEDFDVVVNNIELIN